MYKKILQVYPQDTKYAKNVTKSLDNKKRRPKSTFFYIVKAVIIVNITILIFKFLALDSDFCFFSTLRHLQQTDGTMQRQLLIEVVLQDRSRCD